MYAYSFHFTVISSYQDRKIRYIYHLRQITFWEVGLLLENQVCFRSLVKIHLSFFVEVNIFNCQQWQFYSLKILISTLKLFKNPFSSYYRIKLNFDLNSTSFVFSWICKVFIFCPVKNCQLLYYLDLLPIEKSSWERYGFCITCLNTWHEWKWL